MPTFQMISFRQSSTGEAKVAGNILKKLIERECMKTDVRYSLVTDAIINILFPSFALQPSAVVATSFLF
jgi:hypothetical protein